MERTGHGGGRVANFVSINVPVTPLNLQHARYCCPHSGLCSSRYSIVYQHERWCICPGSFRMPRKILIADDQPSILSILRTELGRDPSFEICGVATNGAEAVIQAQNLCPDLIILDLAMPIMTGLDAARSIAKMMPAVPILLYTLNDFPGLSLEAASAGVRAVISKTAGIKALLSAITDALPQERSAVPSLPGDILAPVAPIDPASVAPQNAASPSAAPDVKKLS